MRRIISSPLQTMYQHAVEEAITVPFYFIRLADASTMADSDVPLDPTNVKTMATIAYFICGDHKKISDKKKDQFFSQQIVRFLKEDLKLAG
jgi:hypothetical protein